MHTRTRTAKNSIVHMKKEKANFHWSGGGSIKSLSLSLSVCARISDMILDGLMISDTHDFNSQIGQQTRIRFTHLKFEFDSIE